MAKIYKLEDKPRPIKLGGREQRIAKKTMQIKEEFERLKTKHKKK